MKRILSGFTVLLLSSMIFAQKADSLMIDSIFRSALSSDKSYNDLDYLCNKIGGRICGTPQAAAAVEWAKQLMQEMPFDTVYTQSIMVHHWERGAKESATVTSKVHGSKELNVCALGESVGTPDAGITGEVIEVKNAEQLKKLGKKQISGKIVFFNRPMNPEYYNTFNAYGDAVDQRVNGASEAAKYGAVAVIVRSMSLASDDAPHSGIMHYDTAFAKIPAVAVSTKDADILSKWLVDDYELLLHVKTNCKFYPETESFNVIGEIKGSIYPDQYITVGGHIDAWDNGHGAHDDGVGCMHALDVMTIFDRLKIRPRHTIRVVMFMDEEVAQRGGKKYAALALSKNEKHLAAIESDEGGFTPFGFTMQTSQDTVNMIKNWKPLLEPYGIWQYKKGYSGVDISFMAGQGVPCFGLMTDSQRYFDYQHANTDTFDKVNKRELQLGSAAVASLTWLIDKYWIKY